MDASNVALLIKNILNMTKNINILTIHDCFATNANNIEMIFLNVKLAFLFIYSNDNFITTYHNFIINYIKNSGYVIDNNSEYIIISTKKRIQIPQKPFFEKNTYFKENILGSQYF
jgi:DNA-directed RNA polymerase